MKIVFLIVLVILIGSCKKETPIESAVLTIEPGAYYPVYPGSYWKYFNSYSNGFYDNQVDSVYRLNAYKSQRHDCFITDSVYVPYMNGIPIYGYSLLQHTYSVYSNNNSPSDCKSLVPFLKEDLGGIYGASTSQRGAGYQYDVTSLIDTMTIRGTLYQDIIEVTYTEHNDNNITIGKSKTYYAKNVGLIKRITLIYVWNPSYEGTSIELDSFYINH
jgi:hypothetical protein